MVDDFKAPQDDGAARRHAYLAHGDDRLTVLADGRALTRSEAVALLRRSAPKELARATHVEFYDDAKDDAGVPWRELGPLRVQHSISEMLAPLLAQTIRVPRGRL